jgi:hypothetical protein
MNSTQQTCESMGIAMQSLRETSVADRRGLQLIGMTLAASMIAATIISAILIHRGATGEDYRSSYTTSAQRLG